jgi:hypothetical protein
MLASGCGSPFPPTPPLSAALPTTIGGQTIKYTERSASELGPQLTFFEGAIRADGGDLTTARVAIGLLLNGFTLTAVRVPGGDARRMVDPLIAAGQFQQTARQTLVVGGRSATVLTLPPTTADRAYLYAFADTLVLVSTSQPALAAEALASLP